MTWNVSCFLKRRRKWLICFSNAQLCGMRGQCTNPPLPRWIPPGTISIFLLRIDPRLDKKNCHCDQVSISYLQIIVVNGLLIHVMAFNRYWTDMTGVIKNIDNKSSLSVNLTIMLTLEYFI